eukprot:1159313-Pelagomonas_calceolata.AAC.4
MGLMDVSSLCIACSSQLEALQAVVQQYAALTREEGYTPAKRPRALRKASQDSVTSKLARVSPKGLQI